MKISIAICSYNRADKLKTLLENFQQQILSTSFAASQIGTVFELLLIDNNSSDKTCDMHSFSLDKAEFKYFLEVKPGLSSARNRALKEFTGDLICFLDDDVKLSESFIASLLKISKRPIHEIGIIGARVSLEESLEQSSNFQKYALLSSSVFPVHDFGDKVQSYPFEYKSKSIENPIGACFLMSRNILASGIRFNEDFGLGARKFAETLHYILEESIPLKNVN